MIDQEIYEEFYLKGQYQDFLDELEDIEYNVILAIKKLKDRAIMSILQIYLLNHPDLGRTMAKLSEYGIISLDANGAYSLTSKAFEKFLGNKFMITDLIEEDKIKNLAVRHFTSVSTLYVELLDFYDLLSPEEEVVEAAHNVALKAADNVWELVEF